MAEYRVIRKESHEELEKAINGLAQDSWEVAHYANWSTTVTAAHFVILRR